MDVLNHDWKHDWETFVSAPYIIVPWMLIAGIFAWFFRGSVSNGQIGGLNAHIAVLKERLELAAEKSIVADTVANSVKVEIERQFPAMEATMRAKIDAEFTKLSAANMAVRHAVDLAFGVSSSVSVQAVVTRANNKDSGDAAAQ
jgi:hypothetical protein